MQSHRHITGFGLKVIAILAMTCNHVAHVFSGMMPPVAEWVIYSLGGVTFPVMAYLIVEGYLHTSNIKRYCMRLALFSLISQIPFWLCFGWPELDAGRYGIDLNLNVFFTLTIGLICLWAHDNLKRWQYALVLIAGVLLSGFCDWGLQGPLIVVLFYALRGKGNAGVVLTMLLPAAIVFVPFLEQLPAIISNTSQATALIDTSRLADNYIVTDIAGVPLAVHPLSFAYICSAGYAVVGFTVATIVICNYNGMRGRPMKWFFYVYYPLHLIALWAIHLAITLA